MSPEIILPDGTTTRYVSKMEKKIWAAAANFKKRANLTRAQYEELIHSDKIEVKKIRKRWYIRRRDSNKIPDLIAKIKELD